MANSEDNQAEAMNDFIATLGEIYGVSELTVRNSNTEKHNSPVLVAENALVFLAWEQV